MASVQRWLEQRGAGEEYLLLMYYYDRRFKLYARADDGVIIFLINEAVSSMDSNSSTRSRGIATFLAADYTSPGQTRPT